MNTLEQEAEEYARKVWGVYYDDQHPDVAIIKTNGESSLDDFIAGANSKYVQREKIKAQIEVLTLHTEHPTKPGYKRHDILNKIKELQQQLKELEQ